MWRDNDLWKELNPGGGLYRRVHLSCGLRAFFLKREGRFVVILSLLKPVRGLLEYIQFHYLRVALEMVTNVHAQMLLLWELQSQNPLPFGMLLDVA